MIVTTDEAVELTGISAGTLRQWVMRGDLEPLRRGAKPLRFRYDDVVRVQRDKRPADWQRRHESAVQQWSGLRVV